MISYGPSLVPAARLIGQRNYMAGRPSRHRFSARLPSGTIMIPARIRQSVTKSATQKQTAMPAVMMKFRGDTSHDVSVAFVCQL